MNKKSEKVSINDIYFANFCEADYSHEKGSYSISRTSILLEKTFNEKEINNTLYEEFKDVATDELILITHGGILFPSGGEKVKYIENLINISGILYMVETKNNSEYTDRVYDEVMENIEDGRISKEDLSNNMEAISYLGNYINYCLTINHKTRKK